MLIKLTPADITDLKRICDASEEYLNPEHELDWVLYDDYIYCLNNLQNILQNIKPGTDCYVEFSVFNCLQRDEYLPLSEKIKSFTNDHLMNSTKTSYTKLSRLIFICLVFYNQIRKQHYDKEGAAADYTRVQSDDLINIYQHNDNYYLKLEFDIDKYKLDHDIGGFEIRSKEFKCITVQDAITDITKQRNQFKQYIQQLLTDDNSVMFCDKVSFYDRNQGFIIDDSFNEDRTGDEFSIRDRYKYNGDLELNITLPHTQLFYHLYNVIFKKDSFKLIELSDK